MSEISLSVKLHKTGGPEVLTLEEALVGEPNEHEVLIKHEAIGVNYIDTYYRSGLYKTLLPSGIGSEASGVVVSVGKEVTHLKRGDRVVYATGHLGAYTEKRLVPARHVVKIPDDVSLIDAAALMLKGLTVHYLFQQVTSLSKGDIILFHAAAGGVGLIACQWAKYLGLKLIGTTSSSEKAEIAMSYGAWEVINYQSENVVERVKELTDGKKVPVVFDGVGKSTWEMSLDCLRPKGLLVSFGNASGPVTGVNLGVLSEKGSLFVTRPKLGDYVETFDKLQLASEELFSLIRKKVIVADKVKSYSLREVVEAHRELADRKRSGGILLIP